jgi:hypothetical protein
LAGLVPISKNWTRETGSELKINPLEVSSTGIPICCAASLHLIGKMLDILNSIFAYWFGKPSSEDGNWILDDLSEDK